MSDSTSHSGSHSPTDSSFLHQCGRLFFLRLRPFFFFLLLLFPLIGVYLFLFIENARLEELEDRFFNASEKGKLAFQRKTKKENFLRLYSNSDPYFLDRKIESLSFLDTEINQIESWLKHPALLKKEPFEERLSFLKSGLNQLCFAEESLNSSNQIKETDEKQRRPVQMDEMDLQRTLALMDHLQIGDDLPVKGSPQLIVKELRAKKITTSLESEVLEVEIDLLKREFTTQ